MNIKTSKGFTMIELLVVVAIISVLAGIVLSNTTKYINKGKDSAIEGDLSSVLTNASVYYDAAGNYSLLFSDPSIITALAAADKAYDGNNTPYEVTKLNADSATWAACAQLKSSDAYFCVDSTGAKKIKPTRLICDGNWFDTSC